MVSVFTSLTPERDVYSVSRLNREVKWLLADSFPKLWVEGEISNLSRPASGHLYFTLKDSKAQVRCAMFRRQQSQLDITPENGMQVQVLAQVSLYEIRGDFQLQVEVMEEAGAGALRRAFQALKKKLAKEGLFDSERKLPIPPWPEKIGIITSPTGAAIRDVLTVLQRRFPGLEVIIYPCSVQGEGAKQEISAAIKIANQRRECDVLLLVRGGGSLEDLWPFNEEQVARAVHASQIPIVTGIGHEIDFTIADFTADCRAPTPSAAAETVSPDSQALAQQLAALEKRLIQLQQQRLKQVRQQYRWLLTRLNQTHPARRLLDWMQRLDELEIRLRQSIHTLLTTRGQRLDLHWAKLLGHHPSRRIHIENNRLQQSTHRLKDSLSRHLQLKHARLAELGRALDAVSPLATLSRGYAIVTDPKTGHVITQASQTREGKKVHTRLAQGSLLCEVKEVIEND
ncbi:MAG: exodeoxyribonuclease VII large subunit [Methylothermaceae bacteria B42]|nr:MAG: exodeoxyribonuclease VII large subunit [Methylothermaceae bacteria B42]HHJ38621.1 exodeoxyribonuclease VII large subunit [Methylothermaceae bacterium]